MQNTETKGSRGGSAPDSQGTHFWFMAIQTPNRTGYRLNDYQGVLTPRPGSTRLDLFNDIRREVEQQDPLSRGGIVVAFDLQPNKL